MAEEKIKQNNQNENAEQKNEEVNNQEKTDPAVVRYFKSNLKDVLHEGIFAYTFIAFLGALVIGFLSLGIDRNDPTNKWAEHTAIILAFSWIVANILLMILAFIRPIQKHMFIKGEYRKKLIFIVVAYAFGLGVTALYILFPPTGPFEILSFYNILPRIFGVVYVLWNTIQIYFYKEWMNLIAKNSEIKFIINAKYNQREKNARLFLIISCAFPIILNFISVLANWRKFFTFVDPLNPTEEELLGISYFWVWIVLISTALIALTYRQVELYKRADDFGYPNVFLSTFYIIIWIVFYLKTSSILGSIYKYFHQNVEGSSEIWKTLGDLTVLILSLFIIFWIGILVFRKYVNNNGLPFVVFLLTLFCSAGQVVMTTEFQGRIAMTLITDIVVIVFSLSFYYWYSSYVLRRLGYIQRKVINIGEVTDMINEFAEKITEKIPDIKSNVEVERKYIFSKYKLPEKVERDGVQRILDHLQEKRWGSDEQ